MSKTYVYKWFRAGKYLGTITDKVTSEININQQINTAGSQIAIDLGMSFDEANPELLTSLLVTEDGDFIVTDNLENIIVETDISIDFPRLNDRIEIWEFDDAERTYTVVSGDTLYNIGLEYGHDYLEIARINNIADPDVISPDQVLTLPKGRLIFSGIVSSWESSYAKQNTRITVLSYGVDLDNYLVQIFPNEVLVENNTTDSEEILFTPNKPPMNRIIGIAQTFDPGVTGEITQVNLTVGNNGTVTTSCTVAIYEGTPISPGSLVATVTRNIPTQTAQSTTFQFASAVELIGGQTYYFSIFNGGFSPSETQTLSIGVDSGANFASGAAYTYNDSTGWSSETYDIGFQLKSSSGGIGNQFLSQDPSTILKELIDNYQALGGLLTYIDNSIEITGTVVSYTFKFNTYLEALDKVTELSPANWWWSVNLGTGLITFSGLTSTPQHTFVKGVHLNDLDIAYSLEGVKNVVYYSGGDSGDGSNVLVGVSNNDSISKYGTWLDKPSDNRVTLESTATILANSRLNQYKNPRFRTTITILSETYDLTSLKIGQIVGFANFNSLIDSLQLQIMGINYASDTATLTLAILPPSQSKRIEDIRRNLDKQQTENNPNT